VSRQVTPAPLSRRPTVSVVIPNYNYGAYLPDAVGSVLGQEGVQVEVIIVDDCSTDGSLDVARRLASADDRVMLVEHERNMRHIATYNDGLRRTTGKYVVLMSADDALAPGCLGRAVTLMEFDPSIGLVYGHPRDFSESTPPATDECESWPGATLTWTKWSGQEWVGHMCRRGRNMIRSPEVVMRSELLADLGGGWDPRFPHSADMYLWMRAAAHADVGRVNGRIQAYYRVHDSNMHSVSYSGLLDDFVARSNTYRAFFEIDGVHLKGANRLERLARRRLAREALRQTMYLPNDEDHDENVERLSTFAASVAPADWLIRTFYRVVVRTPLAAAWFRIEAHRTFLRDQRELRVGT